jgi:hypothetical protein
VTNVNIKSLIDLLTKIGEKSESCDIVVDDEINDLMILAITVKEEKNTKLLKDKPSGDFLLDKTDELFD